MPISAFLEETGEDETSKNLKDATLRRRRSWDEAHFTLIARKRHTFLLRITFRTSPEARETFSSL